MDTFEINEMVQIFLYFSKSLFIDVTYFHLLTTNDSPLKWSLAGNEMSCSTSPLALSFTESWKLLIARTMPKRICPKVMREEQHGTASVQL